MSPVVMIIVDLHWTQSSITSSTSLWSCLAFPRLSSLKYEDSPSYWAPHSGSTQGLAWIKEQARKQSWAEREHSCPCAAGQQLSKAPVLRYQPHDSLCPHAEPKSTFFPWGVFFKYLTQVGRKVMNMAFLMANWENRDNILKLLTRINLSGSILSNLSVQVLPRYHRV